MAELKRKDEKLTTADLAGRAENKKPVRDDLAAENRAIDRTTDKVDRNDKNVAIDRAGEDRLLKDRLAGERPAKAASSNSNEEWGGPTLLKREPASEIRNEIRPDARKQKASPVETPSPLFSETDVDDLRGRWRTAQSNFVDEPRRAVEEADQLVATVMQRLADGFASERSNLEKQWDKGDNVSTEDLRLALQRYRSFFDRLLAA